jgi:hypothetical protein
MTFPGSGRSWDRWRTSSTPGPAQREIELWRVVKDPRELRCVALYPPTGIDPRLMEGEDFRRTQLLRDGPAVQELAEEWRSKLRGSGWT